jgi:hypothetical protein
LDKVTTALKIFRILVEQGELGREDYGDLFVEYLDSEVQSILNNFEEEMDCTIKKIGNTLYLLPNYDNSILGFRNKEWREWLGSTATNVDVYLAYYITMFILFKFYSGKNKNPKKLEFLRLVNLIDDLDKRFDAILQKEEAEVQKTEEEQGLNLLKIARYWREKVADEENKKKTKYAVVRRICKLLENEKLIYLIDDDNEIRTTRKLDDIMTYYYLNDSRIEEINTIFSEEGEPDAQDK